MTSSSQFVVRAVRTRQGEHDVFAFFSRGARLLELAEISRLSPNDGRLSGFQRPEIRAQIRAITEYLGRGSVLFPNAIILALAPGVKFTASRGSRPLGIDNASDAGTLTIPLRNGRASAWIVDGQQRSVALSEAKVDDLPVPVVAFVSGELAVQREQFILVNKARPLSPRLIDELLPEVDAPLPRDLSIRKIPSALCTALNDLSVSPFQGIIKRPSSSSSSAAITDSALTKVMRKSIQDPRGALAAFVATDGNADTEAMFSVMTTYWTAVRDVFVEAWGLPPDRSRLMHSAGIEAMGVLMDQIMTRPGVDSIEDVCQILGRIAPHCRWTSGQWEALGRRWNDIQNTPRDVRMLSNLLVALEREASKK